MLVLTSTTLSLRYCIARWQAQSVERPLGHLLLVHTERALVGAGAGLLGQKAVAEPRRCDAGGGVRDVEADGRSMTLHPGHGAEAENRVEVVDGPTL